LAGADRLVVLDLPPLHMSTLAAALMIADAIVVPVTSSELGLAATRQTLRMIETARASRRRRAPVALLVPNLADPHDRREAAGAASELVERRGPTLHERHEHIEACATGNWVGGHAPHSLATREVLALADALEELLGIERGTRFEAALAEHATI
jgi:cellulose biosynthesis protein BcsQ